MSPKFYKVGGVNRDFYLGLPKSKDIDYAVECESFDIMRQAIIEKGGQIYLETPKYFTIRASLPKLGAADYVLCRKDGKYIDGRRPENVEIGTILDDISRRDFCCNAIAIDTDTNEVIDPFDGRGDIKKKLIRCVGNTEDRFKEDYLRLLRAVRFAITKNLSLHDDIQDALFDPDLLDGLNNVSRERIWEELSKCFRFDTYKTLEFFDNYLLLRKYLFINQRFGIWLYPSMKEK